METSPAAEPLDDADDVGDEFEPTLAGGFVVSGEVHSIAPGTRRALPPGFDALVLEPRHLAGLMLAAPLRAEANLVSLEPGPNDWALTIKRGSETLGAFFVSAEAGMAAAVRVAAAAGIDPLAVGASSGRGETSGRVRVRIGELAGEVFVGVSASANGFSVEIRPLRVEGSLRPPPAHPSLRSCPECKGIYGPQDTHCPADARSLVPVSDKPEPGGSIGVYRLGRRLGSGGMGVVLAGEHAFLKRRVAIKLLHRSIEQEPFVGRRFLAEARAAARIRHPGVVEVLDYGLLADGRPYIVMERIDGESLEDRLGRVGHLEPSAALALVKEIALALGAAHERGVIHLDLKPANVILLEDSTDEEPRMKLIDFGAAARAGCIAEDGLIVGTPEYMSPEHARGEPADARSDLYSLGIMLFELLTAKIPFAFDDVWRIFRAHLLEEPPEMVAPGGSLPDAVHALVARTIAKKPGERHQTAAELVADIEVAQKAATRGPWLRWLS